MSEPGLVRDRLRGRRAIRFLTAAALAAACCAVAASGAAAATTSSLAQGHAYRHGVVPRFGDSATPSPRVLAAGGNLRYGGGVLNVGVTTGAPHVFIIFWGSQWGSQSTDAQGNLVLAGDPKGMAPRLQAFFNGLGVSSELWSGVMTQYCEGIAAGSVTCPASASHVGYPSGGALAGVWADESAAAPSQATVAQLDSEAIRAATHFGNTTTTASRNDQYFIVSPTGTHPDGFNTASANFCAWHDSTGASTDHVAFTNMPYVTDAGTSCGVDFVNSGAAGTLDGVTIVGGHEYAETISDQFPAGGWTDSVGNENADKCAWIRTGQGASQNITLSTGTFAVQSTWANDFNSGAGGCEVSHPVVTNGGNTVAVTNPGTQTSTVGTAVSLQIQATDSGGATLTYGATGLPAGLSINSSTGVISGTPTTAGTSSPTVTASDSTGASGSASFSWTVNPAGCTPGQLLGNPGFETGTASPWLATSGVVRAGTTAEPAHSGSFLALLGGHSSPTVNVLLQNVTLPTGCASYQLTFFKHIDTTEAATSASDTMAVQITGVSSPTVLATLATYSNLDAASGYQQVTLDLSAFAGQTFRVRFYNNGTSPGGKTTNFAIDDAAVNVTTGNTVAVTNPGTQTSTVGTAVSLQIQATDSGGATLTYGATGLPAGLSINSSTGVISGTPTTAGTSSPTVTASDSTGASGSASFSWTVNPAGCTPGQLLGNPGFETGTASPWLATSGVVRAGTTAEPAHSGSFLALLGGHSSPTVNVLLQNVTLPTGCASYQLTFFKHIDTTEAATSASDTMAVQITGVSSPTVLATLATYSNLDAASGYQQVTLDLSAFAGQTFRVRFYNNGTSPGGKTTNFAIDDAALNVS